ATAAAQRRPATALPAPAHRLRADEMRDITGSSYYLGGLYTPGAVMIQPADCVRG
ncbi:FAD-dependent oxidoreductase, partial [Mesorhizobium sp. M4B.F.Ca.ET.013.02.1.1]